MPWIDDCLIGQIQDDTMDAFKQLPVIITGEEPWQGFPDTAPHQGVTGKDGAVPRQTETVGAVAWGVQHRQTDVVNDKGIAMLQEPVGCERQLERRERQSWYDQAGNRWGLICPACTRSKKSAGSLFDNAQGTAMVDVGVGQDNINRVDLQCLDRLNNAFRLNAWVDH